ncbi:hypothetical protein IFM89_037420 [Coptis chinensis]|uniref:G-patch domain-containing protein n=1 Tax=Coptis chinensis TaxID=261450 RepID=A0A835J2A2_9MAGN|nr:hypothetical protein IFM89_037420 [Coptis chinensis]
MAVNEKESARSAIESCQFKWDEQTQLYFHASSGFYHDPKAGWYYSSKDGLYYKFENGSYVPFESDKDEEYDEFMRSLAVSDEAIQDDNQCPKCISDDRPENPPPPSEWLEETLINLYLTGYSNSVTDLGDNLVTPTEPDVGCDSDLLVNGEESDSTREIEEGEWIVEDLQDATESSGRLSDEGISWDEENWRAQYGQVVQSGEDDILDSSIIDLWDWEMFTNTVVKKKCGKKKKRQLSRLIGKLVKPSTKLHPSMPSGGRLLRTAAICETSVALVRVSSGSLIKGLSVGPHLLKLLLYMGTTVQNMGIQSTGQVYRLKSPSMKYLASLSTYDSSNPTKDWGFPDIVFDKQGYDSPKLWEIRDSETPGVPDFGKFSALSDKLKNKGVAYRDRAAERRALHGGIGVGPGQKHSRVDGGKETSPVSHSTKEAAAEALQMSFGAGSFARRVLENMGWKEGEALGKTTKGLLQPLQAVGNKGSAGLGWPQGIPEKR